MKIYFEITKPHLKVFSAVCSNFVVVWLVAVLATKDIFALTTNIVLAIVSWYLAFKAEELLQEL